MKVGDIIQSKAADQKRGTKRVIVQDHGPAWLVANIRMTSYQLLRKDVAEEYWKVVEDD